MEGDATLNLDDLAPLLREVSRSFYLTLRVLPRAVRPQIGLAYLLARTTDTVADTELLPPADRIAALERLRLRIAGESGEPLSFGALARCQASPAERVLLEQVETTLGKLRKAVPGDAALIRRVLDTITSGQTLDLSRFATASGERVIALPSASEMDDYTYRVAGCVGEFWTSMCRRHLFPEAHLDEASFFADAVRFGKGLQLVNILRDLPADLRQGRCYLPEDRLRECGLKPGDLLDPANERRLRPCYDYWLGLAEAHLEAGWRYTLEVPRACGCGRVRLACAWPILIGLETIALLRTQAVLDPGRRIKVSRRAVRSIMVRSVCLYPFRKRWERLVVPRPPATMIA